MILLLLSVAIGLGIYGDKLDQKAQDNNIESMSILMVSPNVTYTLDTANANINKKERYEYRGEVDSLYGATISTYDFTFGLLVSATADKEERKSSNYQKPSNVLDLQLSGAQPRYLWDIYYQKYTGLYLSKRKGSSYVEESKDQYNLTSINFGIGGLYLLNKNANAKQLFGHTHKTKSKGHSWLVGPALNYNKITGDSIIPDPTSHGEELSEVEATSLAINFGWGGQYIFKNFYVNGYLTYGLGQQYQKYINGSTHTRSHALNSSLASIDFGYQFQSSLISLSSKIEGISSTLTNGRGLSQNRSIVEISYQYFF